jgi:hypothetical protein
MKKFLFFLLIIFVTAIATVQAQHAMSNSPKRTAINLYSNQHTVEIAKDAEVKILYPNGISPSLVVVNITDEKKYLTVFQCTKAEYEFLQSQLKQNNIQLLLDDKLFVGFTKIIIY